MDYVPPEQVLEIEPPEPAVPGADGAGATASRAVPNAH
jgi:hypothetical protein